MDGYEGLGGGVIDGVTDCLFDSRMGVFVDWNDEKCV